MSRKDRTLVHVKSVNRLVHIVANMMMLESVCRNVAFKEDRYGRVLKISEMEMVSNAVYLEIE